MKKSDNEISQEIKAMESLLKIPNRWSQDTKRNIDAQIKVLNDRMTERQIEQAWYADETSEDFRGGDNETYSEAIRMYQWMMGESKKSPSQEEAL